MNEIEILKKRIEDLERRLNSAEDDKKLENRGFIKTFQTQTDPSTSDTGFRRNITLSGLEETITVPAYPTRWRKLQDGSELYIPLYAYDSRY